MRNVSERSYRGNQNTHCVFGIFCLNRTVYNTMWKNIIEPGRPQMAIWRTRIACWVPKATNTHTHTLRLCNTHWFFHCSNSCTDAPQCCVVRTLPVLLELISKVWQLRPVNHCSTAVLGIEASGARTARLCHHSCPLQLCHHSCPLQTTVLHVNSKQLQCVCT